MLVPVRTTPAFNSTIPFFPKPATAGRFLDVERHDAGSRFHNINSGRRPAVGPVRHATPRAVAVPGRRAVLRASHRSTAFPVLGVDVRQPDRRVPGSMYNRALDHQRRVPSSLNSGRGTEGIVLKRHATSSLLSCRPFICVAGNPSPLKSAVDIGPAPFFGRGLTGGRRLAARSRDARATHSTLGPAAPALIVLRLFAASFTPELRRHGTDAARRRFRRAVSAIVHRPTVALRCGLGVSGWVSLGLRLVGWVGPGTVRGHDDGAQQQVGFTETPRPPAPIPQPPTRSHARRSNVAQRPSPGVL